MNHAIVCGTCHDIRMLLRRLRLLLAHMPVLVNFPSLGYFESA